MSTKVKGFWVNVLLALSSSSLSAAAILRNDPCAGLPNEILTINPRGCKYFFYCRNGEAIEGFCPNNMWFNFDAGICDQPKNVFCTFDVKPPKPDSNEPEHADEGNEHVSCPSTSNDEDSQVITYIPSKTDCGRYFICYHGQPIKLECTEGLHWNAVENKCDQPIDAHCQTESSKPPSQSICSGSAEVFLPHPTECEYFIYCKNGIASMQQCPFYHHWDIITESCKWKQFAVCNYKRN